MALVGPRRSPGASCFARKRCDAGALCVPSLLNRLMQAAPSTATADVPQVVVQKKSGFIVNPAYDCIFFIFSPLLALFMGMAISGTPLSENKVVVWGHDGSVTNIFIGAFIFAHLVIVFFRSHGNQNIFKLYPVRFTVVPIALLVAMVMSRWVLISVSVLAIWWDVYHSSLQTFGLGRIYDMRAGNDPQAGRRLDFLLNLLLYAGPIFAGAVLVDHIESFTKFSEFGDVFLTHIPAYAENNQRYLTWGVLGFGGAFLCYYLYANWRLVQQGHQISTQKVLLYAATGACSIYSWGFNTFGEAFFIMNFFHAFQYFALVWWSEKKTMLNLFHLGSIRWGKPIALVLFLVLGLGYGLWAEVSENQSTFALSVVLVVSIMHFWYDGFIWSVRKKQI